MTIMVLGGVAFRLGEFLGDLAIIGVLDLVAVGDAMSKKVSSAEKSRALARAREKRAALDAARLEREKRVDAVVAQFYVNVGQIASVAEERDAALAAFASKLASLEEERAAIVFELAQMGETDERISEFTELPKKTVASLKRQAKRAATVSPLPASVPAAPVALPESTPVPETPAPVEPVSSENITSEQGSDQAE